MFALRLSAFGKLGPVFAQIFFEPVVGSLIEQDDSLFIALAQYAHFHGFLIVVLYAQAAEFTDPHAGGIEDLHQCPIPDSQHAIGVR